MSEIILILYIWRIHDLKEYLNKEIKQNLPIKLSRTEDTTHSLITKAHNYGKTSQKDYKIAFEKLTEYFTANKLETHMYASKWNA